MLVRTPEQLEAAIATAPRQHHARLSGSLRPASLRGTRAGSRHRGARRKSARAEAGRRADRPLPAEARVPDPGAIRRPARLAPPDGSAGVDRRLQPQRRQRRHRANASGPRPVAPHAHARPERRADRRPHRGRRSRDRSKPSPISICPCSTPSIASSAAFSRPAPATRTAATPARSIASRCATSAASASGDGRRGLPQHRVRRRGAGGELASRRVARRRESGISVSSSCTSRPSR